jgi:hypothetical protein
VKLAEKLKLSINPAQTTGTGESGTQIAGQAKISS